MAEEKKVAAQCVRITVEPDNDGAEEGEPTPWMLTFEIRPAPGCKILFIVERPDCTPLEAWRALARGEPKAAIGDADENDGTISIERDECQFCAGTNCRETTGMSSTVSVPHAWVAAELNRALDQAIGLGLPFGEAT